ARLNGSHMPANGPTPLEAARGYLARGWPVFPVFEPVAGGGCACGNTSCQDVGKHPRTPHGVKDATTEAMKVMEWWTRWPQANIGLATGKAAGVVVLDVDTAKGGDKSLANLTTVHGPLPVTPEAGTGGGGRHLVFSHPGDDVVIRNGVNLCGRPGLDV